MADSIQFGSGGVLVKPHSGRIRSVGLLLGTLSVVGLFLSTPVAATTFPYYNYGPYGTQKLGNFGCANPSYDQWGNFNIRQCAYFQGGNEGEIQFIGAMIQYTGSSGAGILSINIPNMYVVLGATGCFWPCGNVVQFSIILSITDTSMNPQQVYTSTIWSDSCGGTCAKNYYTPVNGQVSFYKYTNHWYGYHVGLHAYASAWLGASADGYIANYVNYFLLQ